MLDFKLPGKAADWLARNADEADAWSIVRGLIKQNQLTRAAALIASSNWASSSILHRHRLLRPLLQGREYDKCVEIADSLLRETEIRKYPKVKHAAQHITGLVDQHRKGAAFLAETPLQTKPLGFVLFFDVQNPILSGLMVPLAYSLTKRGFATGAASYATIETAPSGVREFDELCGCIAPDGQSFMHEVPNERLRNLWIIDWSAGIAEVDGVNYFAYLHERVAQQARRYKVDIATDKASAQYFAKLLKQSDVALSLCKRLLPLAALGLPIRIAMMDSHFAPAGIIRQWCYQVGVKHDIHAVAMGVGYENYFSNLTTAEAGTLVINDMTAQPDLRVPVLGGPYRFKQFLSERPEASLPADATVLSWINQDRSLTDENSDDRRSILTRIREAHEQGRKVFMAMGKVSIDFAAPGDQGWAHTDFIDWMNHLIEAAGSSDNLLLIKPHPHELRKEIVVNGVEMLRDLIPQRLPENVIFLSHSTFNSYELAGDLDAVLLWNGMGTVEFPILNVPVVPASIWNQHDYPVGTEILRTRSEYEELLSGNREISVSPEVQRLCAGYLRFLRSDFLSIPFRYVRRAAVNEYVGPPTLYDEDLNRLRNEGDPHVERAASRFFEFDGL